MSWLALQTNSPLDQILRESRNDCMCVEQSALLRRGGVHGLYFLLRISSGLLALAMRTFAPSAAPVM